MDAPPCWRALDRHRPGLARDPAPTQESGRGPSPGATWSCQICIGHLSGMSEADASPGLTNALSPKLDSPWLPIRERTPRDEMRSAASWKVACHAMVSTERRTR